MKLRTIDNFLDVDQRLFAKSVVEDRAIPSCIDGFKPVQRKIVFVANKIWKNGNEKSMKVFQFGGYVSSMALYPHGDRSMYDAITYMGQTFKNSLPLLEGYGQYGSLRVPSAGAPRYIGTKLSKNFRLLYKDFELLENRIEEGYVVEPNFFLPIVPTLLLNGSPGIAVGYSTNILNRNPVEVVDACIAHLNGKKPKELKPWLAEFGGTYTRDKENKNKWLISGVYKVLNTTTVRVTDLPPSITFEKYEEYLDSLVDKKVIVDYDNNSSSVVDYVVKFTRTALKELIESNKLESVLHINSSETENVVTLDENGRLLQFDKAEDIVPYFCDYRLTWYDKRKKYLIGVLEKELMVLTNKARFVKSIIDKKLKVNNVPKKEICDWLEANKFDKVSNSFDYLINMPIYSLTKERYAELIKERDSKKVELEEMRKKVPSDMYLDDLKSLKKTIKN
jgi:DNA topoisomerase-2